jgi:hypothetical protein
MSTIALFFFILKQTCNKDFVQTQTENTSTKRNMNERQSDIDAGQHSQLNEQLLEATS